MSAWYLEDVVGRARDHPDQFFIPSEQERRACAVGDLVCLHFVLRNPTAEGPRAERMWVEVAERLGEDASVSYKGVLTNQPANIGDLGIGSVIEFLPVHIAQTIVPKSHPDWLEAGEKGALVSERVLEKGSKARFVYREAPDHDEDSGWRLFRGDETQEYMDEAANIRRCNVGWLVGGDPVFRNEVGSAFERENEDDDWTRIEDWHPPQD